MNQILSHNLCVLLQGPFALGHAWIQMIVPPFATLLADAPRQMRSNTCPILGTLLIDTLNQDAIFIFRPGGFSLVRTVPQLQVSLKALDFRLTRDKLAYAIPRMLPKSFDIA